MRTGCIIYRACANVNVRSPFLPLSLGLGEVPAVIMQGQAIFSLYDSYLEHCITLWALDDDVITPSWNLTFQLILNPAVYDYYPVANGSIVLMPNQVQLTVVDNDGKCMYTCMCTCVWACACIGSSNYQSSNYF